MTIGSGNARMVQGWALVNQVWYYRDPVGGDMKTGRIQVDGVWYELGTDGSLIS